MRERERMREIGKSQYCLMNLTTSEGEREREKRKREREERNRRKRRKEIFQVFSK